MFIAPCFASLCVIVVVHPHPKMVLSAIALGGRGDFPPLSLLGDLGKG